MHVQSGPYRGQELWIGAGSRHSVFSLHRAPLLLFVNHGKSSLVREESSVWCVARRESDASGTDLSVFHIVTT